MAINEEQAIRLILKANGITGPLVPLAIKVLREQFDSGEAFGSDVLGAFTPFVNPAGTIVAAAGKKKRSRKQKAQDKKKSEAWALANAKGRRKNGEFYAGWDQRRIAGEFYAGWDQRRIAEYANKVLKKL